MLSILNAVTCLKEYRALCEAVRSGRRAVSLYGVSPIHKAHILAALVREGFGPLCIVSRDEQAARRLLSDLAAFGAEGARLLPPRDFIFHNIDNVSREFEQMRIGALGALLAADCPLLLTTADALMQRTLPPDVLRRTQLTLEADGDYDLAQLAVRLTEAGYSRSLTVEGAGQFAVRGGILDVFPAGETQPIRAEFFGDTIDSLGVFDPMTQRRTENVDRISLSPCRETLPHMAKNGMNGLVAALQKLADKAEGERRSLIEGDIDRLTRNGSLAACDRYMEQVYDRFTTALDYLPDDAIIVTDDTPAVTECAKSAAFRNAEDLTHLLEQGTVPPQKHGYALSDTQLLAAMRSHRIIMLDAFLTSSAIPPDELLSLTAKQLPSYSDSLDTAVSDLSDYLSLGYTLYALAGGSQRAANLRELLTERGLPCVGEEALAAPGKICVLPAGLSAGFEYPSILTAVVTDGTQQARRSSKKSKKSSRDRVKSFSDLTPGDLVVHDHHGIGRFVGVERICVDKVYRDYIKIAYDGSDFVFVPATSLDLVSKYIGAGENASVRLNKLGGVAWAKAKTRAKKAAADLAEGLIALYSARQKTQGFAFAPDDDFQHAFEENFPYDETYDQLTCTQDIKRDMEKPVPMDRLLCGDVGFGKTEVAFRAMMKCVLSGKQTAILVPTTVLARQHFLTACARFAGFPVKIEMMSRFRTPGQQRETLARLRNGQCDIVVGTHRILQKDVGFKDLGLLVVDEEQRFGVAHKERVKQMTTAVDVLTLTATPIPRTLNMALSGIRDMSVLEDPPVGRQPVQTYVLEHDNAVVRDAIRRELGRNGQVYYLHNRIDSIEQCAAGLRTSFPDAVIATAHGRMTEEQMSDIMTKMYAGEIDILVCTTIIETGVDISNVNTLIIEDADHMGLAQLHQLRGRVGRSPRHAYAYFTYRRGKVLTEISQKRLSAIREFAEFGSGFKIAMRDLEIRGAGNVLGAEQSGHMMSVGYDMYLRLLEEAASELTGAPKPERTDCTADILVSASLPQDYVPDAGTRVDFYRRIAMIHDREDYLDMQDELIDRFGDPPRAAIALLDIALLRAHASRCGICEIVHKSGSVQFTLRQPDLSCAAAVCAMPRFKGRILLNAGDAPYLFLRLKPTDDVLDACRAVIDAYLEAKGEHI